MAISNKDYYKWYIAAIIDGEGYVNVKGREVVITNTDISILDFCQLALNELDIHNTKYLLRSGKDHWKPCYGIMIFRRSDLKKIYLEIPVQALSKKNKLKEIYDLPIKRKNRKEWPIKDIVSLYDEGYSCKIIAEKLGLKSQQNVARYMKKLGHPRRSRSEANRISTLKGSTPTKLNPELVRYIRSCEYTPSVLATIFDVSTTAIEECRRKETWVNV